MYQDRKVLLVLFCFCTLILYIFRWTKVSITKCFLEINLLWSEHVPAKKARVAAGTPEEALDGLEPAASDWHAEANFLQVSNECNWANPHCKNCGVLCPPNEQHTIGVISHRPRKVCLAHLIWCARS